MKRALSPSQTLRAWAGALRPHQWVKNIVLFVPLFVGHVYDDPARTRAAILGFLIMCVLVSGCYLVNDLFDRQSDRAHPTKRARAIASGRLPAGAAVIIALVLIGIALGAGFALSPAFATALVGYLLLAVTYSWRLKSAPMLDVVAIAALFTLRVVAGAAVVQVTPSPWLLTFAFSFFLSLALAKRHTELMQIARTSKASLSGRGYRGDDWPVTLAFGVGAGTASIVIMLLYMASDAAPSGFYRQLPWLYVAPGAVSLWLMRLWLRSHRGELTDDPVVFVLKDAPSLLLGLLVAIAFVLAV